MAERFGPLEICCDAPPYGIVQGCRLIDIKDPEDVAWFRLTRHVLARRGQGGLLNVHTWKAAILGAEQQPDEKCVCGRTLPALAIYVFTLASGEEVAYLLGQCNRCRTVFWEEASVPASGPAGWP